MINERNARTAQHVDQDIRHTPHGCSDRQPTVSRIMTNITLHMTRQYVLSSYLSNNTFKYCPLPYKCRTRWRNWLKHCATSRKVVGSIPYGIIDIILPAAVCPWSTQPLIEMSEGKVKGLPQQAEVARGFQGRLRSQLFLTFGTTRVVGCQPYAPAAFTTRDRKRVV